MKKRILLPAISALALLGVGTLTAHQNEAAIQSFGVTHDYLVELADGSAQTRNAFLAGLTHIVGTQYQVKNVYSHAFTGVNVSFNANALDAVGKLPNVKGIFGNTHYDLPEEAANPLAGTSSGVAKDNYSRETMNVDFATQTQKGKGVTIGILDTGLFYTQVAAEANEPDKAFLPLTGDSLEDGAIDSQEKLDAFVKEKKLHSDGSALPKFASSKVFYEYDYGGTNGNDDNNVEPVKGNEHGTHVASLATANGLDFQGVAPDAQLAILKVFKDNGGADNADVLEALDDAGAMGLDVINLSLGSGIVEYPGLTDKSPVALAVNALKKKGTVVNFAAGNDGRKTYGADTGLYADKVTTSTVETSEQGSYALLDNANVVASSYLDKKDTAHVMVDGAELPYYDANSTAPVSSLENQKLEYALVPGYGSPKDFQSIDVYGKVAVVSRGGNIPFTDKELNAKANGAVGVILVNNQDGEAVLKPQVPTGFEIPVITVASDAAGLFNPEGGSLKVNVNTEVQPNAQKLSGFSSDGGNASLTMGPDITAPGDQILGAVDQGYESMSGTSMATPNFTGAVALLLGEKKAEDKITAKSYLAYKKSLSARIQSTATPLKDDSGETGDSLNLVSPRRAGAGLVNVTKAQLTKAYAETYADDGTTLSGKAALEFKNGADFSAGKIAPVFAIHNSTGKSIQYRARLYVSVPEVKKGITQPEYDAASDASKAVLHQGLANTDLQSTDDHLIGVYDYGTIGVPASKTADGTQVILPTVDAKEAFKDEDGNSLLESYVSQYYPYGTYLEGYVLLDPIDASSSDVNSLSIPYTGFFGDFGSAPAAELFDFQKDPNQTYNSDLTNTILRGTFGVNYDVSSSIYAIGTKMADAYDLGEVLRNITRSGVKPETYGVTHLGLKPDGTPDPDGLVAGVPGKSDVLMIQRYMNRSAYYGTVTLEKANGNVISDPYIIQNFAYGSAYQDPEDPDDTLLPAPKDLPANGQPLYKSYPTDILLQANIGADTGAAAVPLFESDGETPLADGEYQLRFTFVLQAKDRFGNRIVQNNEVIPLTIKQDAPVAYVKAEAVGEGLKVYVSKETDWVWDYSNDIMVRTQSEEGSDFGYAILLLDPANPIRYIVFGNDEGNSRFAMIDTNTEHGNAIIVEDPLSMDTQSFTADFFTIQSEVSSDGKSLTLTPTVMNANQELQPAYLSIHGFSVSIGSGLTLASVKAKTKAGDWVNLDAIKATYTYDPISGQLTIQDLPIEVVSVQATLA